MPRRAGWRPPWRAATKRRSVNYTTVTTSGCSGSRWCSVAAMSSLAQDTVQSVFVTAAAKLRRIDGEEHLWNWLARVARQHLAKAWRQRGRDSAVVSVADPPDCPDAVAPDSVLEENLDAALQELDEEERRLIESFYFDRLSHQKIAEQLNATPKAVSSRLERARARLRSLITRRLSHET